MSDELQKQFFETRQKHKQSYSKRGYVLWILIALAFAAFLVTREIITRRDMKAKKDEALNRFLNTGKVSLTDTICSSKFTGSRVLVLANCRYQESKNGFIVVKADSSGLNYVIKRIISDANFSSSLKQWENQLAATDNVFTFTNLKQETVDHTSIETADIVLKGTTYPDMKGKIKLTKKGGLIYVLQIHAFEDHWSQLSADIERVEQSFSITE